MCASLAFLLHRSMKPHLVDLESDLVLDHLAAREGGNVLQVAALALAEAGGLDGHHLQAAPQVPCQLVVRFRRGVGITSGVLSRLENDAGQLVKSELQVRCGPRKVSSGACLL